MIIKYGKNIRYPSASTYYDEGIVINQCYDTLLMLFTKGNNINQTRWVNTEHYSIEEKEIDIEDNIYSVFASDFGEIFGKLLYDNIYYTGNTFVKGIRAELVYKSKKLEKTSSYRVGDCFMRNNSEKQTLTIYKTIETKNDNIIVENCFTKEREFFYNDGGIVVDEPIIDSDINTKRIVKMPKKLGDIFIDLKDVNKIIFDNLGKYLLADLGESLTLLKYNVTINKSLCNYKNLYYDYVKQKTYSLVSNKRIYITNNLDPNKICPECGQIIKNIKTHKCKKYCPKCGRVLKTAKEIKNDICIKCKEKYVNHFNSHWAKKEPIFEKPDKRARTMHFGVELEIDSSYSAWNNSKRKQVLKEIYKVNSKDIFNPLCYTESDGSLGSDGIEMVFNPKTLSWYKKKTNQEMLKDLFKKFLEKNYTSHKNGKCGLHIHINRKTLGKNHKYTAGKIVFFVNKLWDDYFLPLSRRESGRDGIYYCKKLTVLNADTELELHQKAADDRYVLINCANSGTIEFRLWRGTLNMDSFLNSIYLTNSIIKFCRKISLNKLQTTTFKDFYKTLSDYEKEYCKVKLHKTEEEICA